MSLQITCFLAAPSKCFQTLLPQTQARRKSHSVQASPGAGAEGRRRREFSCHCSPSQKQVMLLESGFERCSNSETWKSSIACSSSVIRGCLGTSQKCILGPLHPGLLNELLHLSGSHNDAQPPESSEPAITLFPNPP